METKTKEKVENVDLMLKSVWLAVSKMYSEQASMHNSTAVQALTLLKIDPKKEQEVLILVLKWLLNPLL